MNEKLHQFHDWLQEQFDTYVSMILVGSVATRDTWIAGRSDVDILILFENLQDNQNEKIQSYLSIHHFDETYLFLPMVRENWVRNKNHSHDFSGKFRTTTLFGNCIINQKQIPNKEKTLEIYTTGLEVVRRRISRTLINKGIWSEEKIRNIFWKLFKHSFMYLCIKYYHDKNIFPRTRRVLVTLSNFPVLNETLDTLNNIDSKNKSQITLTARKLLDYICSL
jgi:hypothetical protein